MTPSQVYRQDMSRRERIVQAVLAISISLPLFLLFDNLGLPELGRPVALALLLFILVIRICWDLRSRPLFWITISALAALHVPLISYTAARLDWMPFPAILGFVYLDAAAIVFSIERVLGEKTTLKNALSRRVDLDAGWLSQESDHKTTTEMR